MSGSCCSLVGDPKTGLTIVSERRFLKFITVMIDIQRMDKPLNVGAAAGCDLLILSFDQTLKIKGSQPSAAPT
jgi:hypothetical protein